MPRNQFRPQFARYQQAHGYEPDEQKESEIQRGHIAFLREAGWLVRSMSQRRRVEGDLVGFPDVIAFRFGVTLLIEEKAPGGRIRKEQSEFKDELKLHEAATLIYLYKPSLDDLAKVVNEVNNAHWKWIAKQ